MLEIAGNGTVVKLLTTKSKLSAEAKESVKIMEVNYHGFQLIEDNDDSD